MTAYEYLQVTIDYTYDGLYRLTMAEYSTGEVFEYTYDAAGNRLTQTVTLDETPVTTTYTYDEANRLSQVDAQAYTWDNNGNLLNDGEKQYSYDPANRLTALVEGEDTTYYLYNGQGDRIAQVEDGVQTPYILDLNAGLTQVLNDGTSAYVYGLDLVSQQTGIYEEYPLRDALGSVRQMTDQSSAITGYKSFEPYGSLLASSGETDTPYGFAGEWMDASGMQYLRARYYDPSVGRFVSRDSWRGTEKLPITYHKWLYGYSNPIVNIDPSGMISCQNSDDNDCIIAVDTLLAKAKEIHARVSIRFLDPDNNILPVEALAELTDYAFEIFNNDRKGMMWGMTKVIVGIDPNDYKYLTLQPANQMLTQRGYENENGQTHEGQYFVGQDWLSYREVDDTIERGDWNSKYFDKTPNQAFHFWYFAAGRYFDGNIIGEILTNIANNYHDPYYLEPFCGPDIEKLQDNPISIFAEWAQHTADTSQEDYDLAVKGIQFGRYLESYEDLPITPGNWIRNNLKSH